MQGSFLGALAACAMLLFFLLCGYVAACCLLRRERWLIRAWIGGALGLVLMMWLPALWAFPLGFGVAAQLAATVSAGVLAAGLYLWKKPCLRPRLPGGLMPLSLCVVPLTALAVYLLIHHTLRPVEGALHTGQSGFGDMSMHLGFVTSLARQGFFPPEYSILPGVPLGYPFLCDSISSSLYVLGAPLRLSYILPAAVAMLLCFLGFYLLALSFLGSRRKAVVAFFLFFLGGGFGFAYFFDHLRADPDNFLRIFTAFYETPTNLIEQNIRWVNPVADLMLPQRATLFGWAVLLPCLYLLWRTASRGLPNALVLGLLAGALPMIHTHSFLALGLLSLAVFLREMAVSKNKPGTLLLYLPYGLIALALAAPQLLTWTLRQSQAGNFLGLHFNWGNLTDNYLWFYIKNIGVVALVILPAVLHAPRRQKAFFLCALPIWILAEFMVFQPNEYDNNKLLYVVYMLACALAANLLCDMHRKLRGLRGRSLLTAGILAAATLSGALTLIRETVSDYELFSSPQVKAARFIDENLPQDATFLTADNHNNMVAALTGRNILMGSQSYLYYHGVADQSRSADLRRMLRESGALAELAGQYDIDYVLYSPYEAQAGLTPAMLAGLEEIYDREGVRVYRVR